MFHVKPEVTAAEVAQVMRWADDVGAILDASQASLMLRYLHCVLAANQSVNLTSITEASQAIRLHIVDSLTAAQEVRDAPAGLAVDLGSGGGFPGVPLALSTGRAFVLIDSISDRVRRACARHSQDYCRQV
jgi:16S rRNA G527 N7-methylase RsmG